MEMTVAVQKQRRQVKHVELACQRLRVSRVDFNSASSGCCARYAASSRFQARATAAACAREHHQRAARVPASRVMESELVERRECAHVDFQKYGFSLAFL